MPIWAPLYSICHASGNSQFVLAVDCHIWSDFKALVTCGQLLCLNLKGVLVSSSISTVGTRVDHTDRGRLDDPGSSSVPPEPQDWTLLVYTSSSADIEEYSRQSLKQLAQQAPSSLKVAVQWGRPDNSVERFIVEDHKLVPAALGQGDAPVDQASPQNLQDFLQWGMKKFPARHYAVVIGGHGAGFMGCVTDGPRRKMMRLPQLRQALENSPRRPDLVAFNSCLMGGLEMAEELGPLTPVLVGAQGPEHGLGMPLAQWAQALPSSKSGAQAAQALVAQCRLVPEQTPLISALDSAALQTVHQDLQKLCVSIQEHPESLPALRQGLEKMRGHWEKPAEYPLFRQIDIGQLSAIWAGMDGLAAEVRLAAAQLGKSSQEMVLATTNQGPMAQEGGEVGVSIFAPTAGQSQWQELPLFDGSLGQLYSQLRLSKTGEWDETIELLTKGS